MRPEARVPVRSHGERPRGRAIRRGVAGLLALLLAAASGVGPIAAQEGSATELRVSLSRLLGEHALLTLDVVRTGAGVGAESAAAAAALEANSAEIVAAIESVYGPDAADAFGQLWRDHIGYLVDYARAGAAGDTQAAELASDQLNRYVADFSELVATAIPELPQEAVSALIDEHVQQLSHVADLDEAAFDDAYRSIRETYHHMFTIGDALARGITDQFPDRFPGGSVAFSAASDVRVTLDRLFGEHTYLAALAMRAHLVGAPDASSATQALRENGSDLSAVMADIYGITAADAFGAVWESHIDGYLAYVEALTLDDRAAQDAALDDLAADRGELSAFVADANPHVTRENLEVLIGEHNDLLVAQADDYARADYASAYEAGREAYRHSGHMAAALAAAIAEQFPHRFPDTALPPPAGPDDARQLAAVLLLALAVLGVESRRSAHRRDAGRSVAPAAVSS